jgi:hypothetical protein
MPAPVSITPLAQTVSILGWSAVLILFIVGAFMVVMWLRRWIKEDDVPTAKIGFSLTDLRELHRRGEMSDDEFERARAKMTAAAKAANANMPDPAGGRRAPGVPPRNDHA